MFLHTTTDLEYIACVVSSGDDSYQESPTKTPAISVATHKTYDGFLYQCRVSPKISARVGGNRNGRSNGFLNDISVMFLSGQRVSSRWHNKRGVPVLTTRTQREVKPVISLHDGYQPEHDSGRDALFFCEA
jgi:hypothetical protein